MLSELTRQKQIIEKTIHQVSEGISSGIWKFTLNTSDNVGSGDIYEMYITEGNALYKEFEVILKVESKCSLKDDDHESYSWYFSSNLKKSNCEEAFIFKGGIDGVIMQYGGYSPDEKYMFDLIINSIDFLEKTQTAYDLQDIDGIM
ncbi:hypothetical protein [Nodularia spumigena]|uniref:Uncharacterized protein n=2 Tax=Nodularia spumigena TaxID=70799 RepID=A0A2S0Q4W9_NODSP|nr:hypothetical protein [Nodularia spumigena]AVZ31406.1 hypothetical protein BMF81_04105 [Nodularia spumigena UHCC 0039]MEA5526104.1 hypothetical protein [Nodularia spumigena UHCC 0143]MEA5609008.1 hypothetical protein [Nodularia spumigena UHCC 0060]MEA5613181.1 hypothetical protein [Nodularia spumigena UHCC 0040]